MNESLRQERDIPRMRDPRIAPSEIQAKGMKDSAISQSFEVLFLEHWAMVYRLLERMIGDPAEAEDLAMETFYRLYQNPPESGPDSNIRGWLFRVATNLGLHSIRSAQRRQRYEMAAGRDALEDPMADRPAEILDSKEANHLARLALGKLPPRQAQLLALRYSGLAYKEIAAAMGLAPSSIGPLLLRAERDFAKIYRSLSREEE
jgi:RNA polymerase sigma factor (sigma-70 family)